MTASKRTRRQIANELWRLRNEISWDETTAERERDEVLTVLQLVNEAYNRMNVLAKAASESKA